MTDVMYRTVHKIPGYVNWQRKNMDPIPQQGPDSTQLFLIAFCSHCTSAGREDKLTDLLCFLNVVSGDSCSNGGGHGIER
jgi:hypothetical protein